MGAGGGSSYPHSVWGGGGGGGAARAVSYPTDTHSTYRAVSRLTVSHLILEVQISSCTD